MHFYCLNMLFPESRHMELRSRIFGILSVKGSELGSVCYWNMFYCPWFHISLLLSCIFLNCVILPWQSSAAAALLPKGTGVHRIMKWFGLEEGLKIIPFQPHCNGQVYLPPKQVFHSPIQPGLKQFHGWISHNRKWSSFSLLEDERHSNNYI